MKTFECDVHHRNESARVLSFRELTNNSISYPPIVTSSIFDTCYIHDTILFEPKQSNMDIEQKALWVMSQYEEPKVRTMYALLMEFDIENFREWSNSFFFWLVTLTTEKKSLRSEVISKINSIRKEQKDRIREATEHEQNLTEGLPENDL